MAVTDGRPARTPRLIWRNVSPCGQAERFGDNGSLFYWFATNDWSTLTCTMLDLDSVAARFGEPVRLARSSTKSTPVRRSHPTGGSLYSAPATAQRRARADDRTRTGRFLSRLHWAPMQRLIGARTAMS